MTTTDTEQLETAQAPEDRGLELRRERLAEEQKQQQCFSDSVERVGRTRRAKTLVRRIRQLASIELHNVTNYTEYKLYAGAVAVEPNEPFYAGRVYQEILGELNNEFRYYHKQQDKPILEEDFPGIPLLLALQEFLTLHRTVPGLEFFPHGDATQSPD